MDGTGNRISQTVGGATTTFAYSVDDELLSTTGGFANTYGYNANGEQTTRTLGAVPYSLDYDYDGQLTSVASPTGSAAYAYDALGRRVSRTAGGTATQYVYGPGGILQERQGSTWTAAYTYGTALLRRNTEVPLYDALGSERTVTDGTGAVTGSIAYEAFGQPVATSGSSASPYTFAATSGYRNDGDAGLTHVGARYYDAQVGRFITCDTVLDQHPYLYCDHDPVNALDPSGHDWYYHIGSGSLSRRVAKKVFYVGDGYSGAPGHQNDPGDVGLPGQGPIPPGGYDIGDPVDGGHMGRYHIGLVPDPGNNMYGRDGFYIHGDNSRGNRSASMGCIILSRPIRERIVDSGDTRLIVVP